MFGGTIESNMANYVRTSFVHKCRLFPNKALGSEWLQSPEVVDVSKMKLKGPARPIAPANDSDNSDLPPLPRKQSMDDGITTLRKRPSFDESNEGPFPISAREQPSFEDKSTSAPPRKRSSFDDAPTTAPARK